MKNEIEKLLSDVKTEYSKVLASAMKCRKEDLQISAGIGTGQALSFEYVIERLEKILNERNSVDEVKKVCEHNWEYDSALYDCYCKKCDMRKPTGANF